MKGVIWMKKESLFSIILLVLFIFILIGCAKEEVSTVLEEHNQIISVAVKVDFINNETLEELKAQGLVINDTEQSKTYGNVVFGKINKSKVGDLPGEVKEGVDEREYKTEVLKEIGVIAHPSFQQNERDLNLLAQSQVVLDEEREQKGIIKGPIIEDQLIERVTQEEFVPVFISFRIEAWNNSKQYGDEIKSEVGEDIKIDVVGWRGIVAWIDKSGLEKLKNKDYLIMIAIRSP